ncbi:Rpp14/Pop5 family-domain-containing protein [Phaeosphaeriaceae sp. PMI808]|nr:Rpp14/Pop5 family-domain-containing protein [Phaeosphaeriaceae sp. PMI808]
MVRIKYRYLVVNFLYPEPAAKSKTQLPDLVQIHSPTPDSFHAGILVRMIRDEIADLYGDYGMGMVSSGLKVNYWSPSTSTAIIRCPRDHYEMVWSALTYITHLPRPTNLPVVIRIIRISGTIKKAEEEVIRRSQLIIKRAKAWEGNGDLPMLQSVERAADKERKSENEVLAHVDAASDDENMSE